MHKRKIGRLDKDLDVTVVVHHIEKYLHIAQYIFLGNSNNPYVWGISAKSGLKGKPRCVKRNS
jgi:hypothetical protein